MSLWPAKSPLLPKCALCARSRNLDPSTTKRALPFRTNVSLVPSLTARKDLRNTLENMRNIRTNGAENSTQPTLILPNVSEHLRRNGTKSGKTKSTRDGEKSGQPTQPASLENTTGAKMSRTERRVGLTPATSFLSIVTVRQVSTLTTSFHYGGLSTVVL